MDNTLKIIDFGTSTEFSKGNETLKTIQGTSYYMAPEVLLQNYDDRCDVWSIGVMLYIFLCGSPPFNGDDDQEITDNVLKGKYSLDGGRWRSVSEQAKKLIKKMLTYDYRDRVTAREALKDEWFQIAPREVPDEHLMKEALTNLRTFNAALKM